jgi:hypothetical protein
MPETSETPHIMPSDDSDDELINETIPFVITTIAQASQNTESTRSVSTSSNRYINELLTTAHPQRCWNVLRMTIETFFALRDWLLTNTSLSSSRKEGGITIEEKIVIFLYITAHNASVREASEHLSYALRTISRLVLLLLLLLLLLKYILI